MKEKEKEGLTSLIQGAIDEGATTVEEIHKSIADLPLKMLEKSRLLKEPAMEIRRVQDHTIGAIYELIRDVNEKVGGLASDLLRRAEARKAATRKPAAHTPRPKHRPAAHAHAR